MSGKVTILEWTVKNPLQQIGYNAGVQKKESMR